MDDNFFINEPILLKNNFFSKMVDLTTNQKPHIKKSTSAAMLLKFCAAKRPPSRIELLDSTLFDIFDRQQLVDTLKRAQCKLSPEEHVDQLKKVLAKFHQNDRAAADYLYVILDAYFNELATTDETTDILNQISAHINSQCAILSETEKAKSLLKSIKMK